MAIHILSVLGTGLYEPVIYRFDDGTELETEFIQLAVINKYYDELKNGGKFTIFLTEDSGNDKGSKSRNWENRYYKNNEVGFANNRWTSEKKCEVIEGNEKKGLEALINERFTDIINSVEVVIIPNMKNESEVWKVFDSMYNSIDNNDELVFDITHSFRSIPMLAVTVINYAKVLKKCELCRVYYGAYEAAIKEDSKEGIKMIAPVIDLTVYSDILDWSYAAEAFVRYGNADKMKESFDTFKKRLDKSEKKNWGDIDRIIEGMQNVTSGIATCRGVDAKKLIGKKNAQQKSIKECYRYLKKRIDANQDIYDKEIIPMVKLLEYAVEELKPFNCEYDYEIGIAFAEWCKEKKMVQQGYTALEETIKTYICETYGLDDVNRFYREDIVNCILMLDGSNKQWESRDEIFDILTKKDSKFGKTYKECDEKTKSIIRSIIYGIPSGFWSLAASVSEYRNDINHMGFRPDAVDSATFIKVLPDKLDEFKELINEDKKRVINSFKQKCFTHSGIFHADDIFATALLKMVYPDIEIIRGNEVPEDFDGIIYDIGRGKYDHHQLNKRVRENGIPYAAFGLLWEEYGSHFLGEKMAKVFDEEIIQQIDLSDNTGKKELLCSMLSGFNNIDEDCNNDSQFLGAVDMAYNMLTRQIELFQKREKDYYEVKSLIESAEGHIMVLDKYLYWKDALVESDMLYVIMESNRGGYNIQAVPISTSSTELKKAFPKEWHGVEPGQLYEMTGIETFTFCHTTGFLCATGTLEDAFKVAELAVEN